MPFALPSAPVLFYDWCLSQRTEEPVNGCWMVDSVMPDMELPGTRDSLRVHYKFTTRDYY